MPMSPLFCFPLPLLFSLACSMNTPLAAPFLQTTRQWNGWILKYQLFHFQPALLAFTTSDLPNSVSHPNPSWGTFHLNRKRKSDHKTSLFSFLHHYVMHLFLSSGSLPFITIGRRQPFPILQPKYNPSHLSLQPSIFHSHHHDVCTPLQVTSKRSTSWGKPHLQYYFSSS